VTVNSDLDQGRSDFIIISLQPPTTHSLVTHSRLIRVRPSATDITMGGD